MGRSLLIWVGVGLRFPAEHIQDGVKQNWWYLVGRLGHTCSVQMPEWQALILHSATASSQVVS